MFPGQVFQGHVDSLAPASGQEFALLPPDNATGNFTKVVQRIPVKIVLDARQPARRSCCAPACRSIRRIDTKAAATRSPRHRTHQLTAADAPQTGRRRAMSTIDADQICSARRAAQPRSPPTRRAPPPGSPSSPA